jgi:hypothetical protein
MAQRHISLSLLDIPTEETVAAAK